jgi:hypothetical protein
MLWLPYAQTRQVIAHCNRLRRRRWARLLLFLLIFFGLRFSSAPPSHALLVQVDEVTASYQFDFVNWESLAVIDEVGRRWQPPALPASADEQRALVNTFLEQERQVRDLEGQLDHLYAQNNDQDAIRRIEQQLAQVKFTQAQLIPQVEIILSWQIEAILHEEGFTLAGQVFPPVAFRFIDPPTALILSPRDKIENRYFVGLLPSLDNDRRASIETTLDQRGDVSSYVTDIGGLASYPTMVIRHPDLIYLTATIAHEWVHNYFFTFPTNIAWAYQNSRRLTTLNETTADIAGQEIGRKVILRFYPDWVKDLPPLDDSGHPAPTAPSEFHLTMRRIRQEVDRLLAEGKITETEAFMEAERVNLVKQGRALRKLNQAYFAFHGSYALSPTSIDPIGPQLRRLRAVSSSLLAFVNRVGWLNSDEDYVNWLTDYKRIYQYLE